MTQPDGSACPRPDKRVYSSRAAAKAARTKYTAPYLCRCGKWHLAAKRRSGPRRRGQLAKMRGNVQGDKTNERNPG